MEHSLQKELRFLADSTRILRGGAPEGYAYASLQEYVLAKGRLMESVPLSQEQKEYLRTVLKYEGGRYPLKKCFCNAQRVVLAEDHLYPERRLAYYEGYATSGILAVLHGWLVLDGKSVVDLTWRTKYNHGVEAKGSVFRSRVIGEIPDSCAYLGLEVATPYEVLEQASRMGVWTTFLDDWRNRYPRLKISE